MGPTVRFKMALSTMLELSGPVPTWLPVQIYVADNLYTITIKTLDGHLLRGEQTFTFINDRRGGTNLLQDARFQASSEGIADLQHVSSITHGQDLAWQNAHMMIYQHFNGNPNYMGLSAPMLRIFNNNIGDKQQIYSWAEAAHNLSEKPITRLKGLDGLMDLLHLSLVSF